MIEEHQPPSVASIRRFMLDIESELPKPPVA